MNLIMLTEQASEAAVAVAETAQKAGQVGADYVFSSVGEAASFALTSSLFGIAVVFGVLALLWGILEVFTLVFYKDPAKNKDDEKAHKAAKKAVEEVAAAVAAPVAPAPVAPAQTPDDGELVAAITAAIEAYRSANGERGGFRVVSFKRR